MITDKLAAAIRGLNALDHRAFATVSPELAADRVREAFVVIDRNDLPKIEDYRRTTAGPVPAVRGPHGNFITWQSIESAAQPGALDERRHEMLAHVALHEHFKANPPVLVDEKAVKELAGDLERAGGVPANSRHELDAYRTMAQRLLLAGWKREAES